MRQKILLGLWVALLLTGAVIYYRWSWDLRHPRRPRTPPAGEASRARIRPIGGTPLRIALPIEHLTARDILDTFDQTRDGDRKHEATDIMVPRGTPVRAVDDGRIVKLFLSKPGGITIYQYDPSSTWCYYYAHLDRYAEGLAEKQEVRRGQVIGYAGSTGNASPDAPHLHFAILELGPDKEWWRGNRAINPYPYLIAALRGR